MTFRILFVIVLLGGGYYFATTRAAKKTSASSVTAASPSPAGFMPMPVPTNAPVNKVFVVAAPNCPKEGGRRAAALIESLRSAGIPCELSGNPQFSVATEAEADRLDKFMSSPVPLVFVRGKARSNPPLPDVIAEYRRGISK